MSKQNCCIKPVDLKCEYQKESIGLDTLNPRFFWTAVGSGTYQSAYRVIAATTPQLLEEENPDLWDSGRVDSQDTIQIEYKGIELKPYKTYFWKVCLWDSFNGFSGWSDIGKWSMGPLEKNHWKGKWISAEKRENSHKRRWLKGGNSENTVSVDAKYKEALFCRKEEALSSGYIKATAFIIGLGYHELYVNGLKAGDHVMDPVFSDYGARVYYVTHDITSSIKGGLNCFGVILGNGFYNMPNYDLFQFENVHWRTPPKFILNIVVEYPDAKEVVISTDESWLWSMGEITYNCIRGGETIDNNLVQPGWNRTGFNPENWKQTVAVEPPNAEISSQQNDPMRITGVLKPIAVTEPAPGIFVFDFGRNITGWARLATHGSKGTKITLLYNEALTSDGLVNTEYAVSHTYGRFQTEEYILAGTGTECFEPRFTYHGFRYVQVSGLTYKPDANTLEACMVYTDLKDAGEFNCANEKLNALHRAVRRTLLDSIHGMPGEEPTREKMGWTLDAFLCMEPYTYNFDAVRSYIKYVYDLIDSQEANGHLTSIAPTSGWGLLDPEGKTEHCDDPWWGAALSVIVDNLYVLYGDIHIVKEAYEAMKHYVDFLTSTAKDGIVDWSLGDWLDVTWGRGGSRLTPVSYTSTAAYYYLSKLLSKHAALLGKAQDAMHYDRQADEIKEVFNRTFLDKVTGLYQEGSQTAQVLPLLLNLVPSDITSKTHQQLLSQLKKDDYHITAGFIGVMPMVNYLSDNDIDAAYKMITRESGSGWLYMLEHELSTLGENLNPEGYGTRHHPFAACIGSWFYTRLAGIQPDPEHPGFRKIIIKPSVPKELPWAKATYHSIQGEISSAWEQKEDKLKLEISIPCNTSAKVYLPTSDVSSVYIQRQSIREIMKPDDISFIGRCVVLSVSSGSHLIECKLNQSQV